MLHRILRISLSLLNLRKAQAAALCQCLLLFCRQRIPGKRTGHTVIAELFKNLYVCLVPNGIFHRKRRKQGEKFLGRNGFDISRRRNFQCLPHRAHPLRIQGSDGNGILDAVHHRIVRLAPCLDPQQHCIQRILQANHPIGFIACRNRRILVQQDIVPLCPVRRACTDGFHHVGIRIQNGEQIIALRDFRNMHQIRCLRQLCPCGGVQRIIVQFYDLVHLVGGKCPQVVKALVVRTPVGRLRYHQRKSIEIECLCLFFQVCHDMFLLIHLFSVFHNKMYPQSCPRQLPWRYSRFPA